MDIELFRKEFGERMKKRMEALSLSQNDVAQAIGVSQSVVSEWSLGRKEPRMKNFDKLCEVLHCSRAYLMGTEEQPTQEELLDAAFHGRPEMKQLFSVADTATTEEILQAIKIIEALKK
ncbi:MAG: helix-turn-helix transcriptional regulator [Bacteroidales bacterium]|nr:helix-turn-helix transcriptional regulator [Candidatus Equimonas faecalis]